MTDVELIKSRLDIADVIQEYVPLRPAGANLKAPCPFHDEKTPSFMVHRGKQIYHCFGCGEGGDIFSFIQKYEGVEFPEALRILAAKAGVTLKTYDPKTEDTKTKLKDIVEAAAKAYEHILWTDAGSKAREYLMRKRGLTESTIREFKLGYAPDAWETISQYLRKKGYKDQDIIQSGLVVQKMPNSRYYDRFRNRIMFPIHDAHGFAVGFTGRLMPDHENDPKAGGKYVNTPETPIFHKAHIVYGLHLAKPSIKKQGVVLFVEGQMDVLACAQAGTPYAVAASGTAATEQHFTALKRITDTVLFALDQDEAGEMALKRSVVLAWNAQLDTHVITLPEDAKDPADIAMQNAAAWKQLVADAKPFMDYFISQTITSHDITSSTGKKQAAKEILSILALMPDPIDQAHYIQKLSEELSIDATYVHEALAKFKRNQTATPKPADHKPQANISAPSFAEKLETQLLALAIRFPSTGTHLVKEIPENSNISAKYQEVYKWLINWYTTPNQSESVPLQNDTAIPKELEQTVSILELVGEPFADFTKEQAEKEYYALFTRYKKHAVSQELLAIEQQLKILEQRGTQDPRLIEDLSSQVNILTKKLQSFNNLR